ncbi:hypothetical protein LCGC14_1726030 [marine sediment metagenome]|uniref:Uncharacterized protein n=1 Tax=marine sediment metagenome TaxID=412755 RepID=A0A0F9HAZ8_9ZZZZ
MYPLDIIYKPHQKKEYLNKKPDWIKCYMIVLKHQRSSKWLFRYPHKQSLDAGLCIPKAPEFILFFSKQAVKRVIDWKELTISNIYFITCYVRKKWIKKVGETEYAFLNKRIESLCTFLVVGLFSTAFFSGNLY